MYWKYRREIPFTAAFADTYTFFGHPITTELQDHSTKIDVRYAFLIRTLIFGGTSWPLPVPRRPLSTGRTRSRFDVRPVIVESIKTPQDTRFPIVRSRNHIRTPVSVSNRGRWGRLLTYIRAERSWTGATSGDELTPVNIFNRSIFRGSSTLTFRNTRLRIDRASIGFRVPLISVSARRDQVSKMCYPMTTM